MLTKNFKQRTAFSLVEVLIVVTILGIMASYLTLSAKSTGQTARAEAEKVAQFFRRYITKADKIHGGYCFKVENKAIILMNNKDSNMLRNMENNPEKKENANGGCSYLTSNDNYLVYNLPDISPNGKKVTEVSTRNVEILVKNSDDEEHYRIQVNGKGPSYWVIISYDNTL